MLIFIGIIYLHITFKHISIILAYETINGKIYLYENTGCPVPVIQIKYKHFLEETNIYM